MRAGRDDQQRDQGVATAMAITDHSCLCAACLAARGETALPGLRHRRAGLVGPLLAM
jgi:hypothetical protein